MQSASGAADARFFSPLARGIRAFDGTLQSERCAFFTLLPAGVRSRSKIVALGALRQAGTASGATSTRRTSPGWNTSGSLGATTSRPDW